MWRVLPRSRPLFVAAGWIAVAACWRASPEGVRSPPSSAADPSQSTAKVGPARFLPDLGAPPSGTTETLPDGTRRFIVSGMRVLDHPDGSLERARQILPNGVARVVSLPRRLGGGLIVYVLAGRGTQLWRAKSWLDDLEPLSEIGGVVEEMAAGFDRLYVRMASPPMSTAPSAGDVRAIDPGSGDSISLGPLPPDTRIRSLAFADAWRAVAVVDFRGALATFDAGNTWRPIPLDGINVNQVSVRDGDFALETPRGNYLLGPGGELRRDESRETRSSSAYRAEGAGAPGSERSFSGAGLADPSRLARRPLRAAVEDGWPVQDARGETTAVFAEGGTLYRVGLGTGAIVETRRGAFREKDGACHAIPLRSWFGFVCGAPDGASTVYAIEPPLEAHEVAHFAHARVVVSSGNGGFVVRGSCARDATPTPESMDVSCFVSPKGDERETKAPGATASENADLRPVVLRDGRALFVVPPKEGSNGKLFVSRGLGFDAVPLLLDDRQVEAFRRSYLLEGVEEREPGILGGWALVGDEFHGFRIALDGHVELGPLSVQIARTGHVERTVVAGRFGFDWGATGRGYETVDGGMTWTPVDLPAGDPSRIVRPVAACGPVGCAKDNWLRIGWGRPGEVADLQAASAPGPSHTRLARPRDVSLRCQLTGEVSGPALPPSRPVPNDKRKSGTVPPRPAPVRGLPRVPFPPALVPLATAPAVVAPGGSTSWRAFRGHPPPALGSAEVGLEAGTDAPMTMQARIYAWGARGSEWMQSGHLQARFDDRFDLLGIRSTAVIAPPWADEDRASDALGLTAGQLVNWSAILDPSGLSAVLIGQRGTGRADLYAAAAGEPLVMWRDADGGPLPPPNSVVRVGPTWFFLHTVWSQGALATTVYRVDFGVVRRLARLPRVPVPPGEFAPKLMRRAHGKGIGILVQGAPGFDQVIRDWYVLPIDPDTGELDEPVRLLGSDLDGQLPERCSDEGDGWLVNTEVPGPNGATMGWAPAARIVPPSNASLGSIELRLRLDPGKACVDAIAARVDGLASPLFANATTASPTVRHHPSSGTSEIPMAATETSSGRRWLLRCSQ